MIKNLALALLLALSFRCFAQSTNVVTVSVQWSTNALDWQATTNELSLTNLCDKDAGFYTALINRDVGDTNEFSLLEVFTKFGTNISQSLSPVNTNLFNVEHTGYAITNIVRPGAVYQSIFPIYTITGWAVPGQAYKVTFGSNETRMVNGSQTIESAGAGTSTNFIAAPPFNFIGLSGKSTNITVTATITPLLSYRPWLSITNITPPAAQFIPTNDVPDTNGFPSP